MRSFFGVKKRYMELLFLKNGAILMRTGEGGSTEFQVDPAQDPVADKDRSKRQRIHFA